jgi:hypothetical protein
MKTRYNALKLDAERPGTRELFNSGNPHDTITRHGVLEPGLAYLPKPFAPDALARKVREVLEAGPAEGVSHPR